jgi:putative endopeptidase
VEQSIHGEKTNTAFLVQGGLGLRDREDYLSADPGKTALRGRYRDYIRKMLTLAGFGRADERASAVLALETAIAQSQGTREASANDRNADNVWTRSDFVRRAPGIDWAVFFDEAGLARQGELVVWQPSAVTGLAALVASQPLEAWKDYLRFHAIHDFADVLPHAFADEALALHAATGAAPQLTRAERALVATQSAMGDALGRMYAERYFPAEQKARVERISDNVRAALTKRVEAATWMSAATKASALLKLQTLYVGIGYPDQWEDDSSLTIDPADPLGNLRRIFDRTYHNAVARLGQPVNLKYWYIAPQKVGAVLVFQQNAYVMAAALLEPPKYDHTSSDAAAYGSVGALIGHDLTHYIDVLGADYDTEHRLRHWWTAEDMQHFQALTQPLVDQFAAYQPLPGLSINGKLTLTENIADLGGLGAAFDAYRKTLGSRLTDTNYVRAQDREFFIAYAQTQRRKISESAMRTQVATNDHAPEDYRADTVRNLDAWYDAFDVRPGQRLYLEPAARVRVW